MSDPFTKNKKNEQAEALLGLALTADSPETECPTPEHISAWREGHLEGPTSDAVQRHVAHCDNCYALWTGLLQAEALEPKESKNTADRPSSLLGWMRGLMPVQSLVTGVVAVTAIGILLNVFLTDNVSIPGYAMSLEGRTELVRGSGADSQSVMVFNKGNRFRLLLTPAIATDEALDTRVYVAKNGLIDRVEIPQAQITPKGVVQIVGAVGVDVLLPAGEAELIIIVAKKGKIPRPESILEALKDNEYVQQERWSAWKIPMLIED